MIKPKQPYSQVFICASDNDERKFLDWAEKELRLAGMYGEGGYDGMIANGVMEMLEVWHKQGHSGMSASITREILNKILNWENLTPLTPNQEEWQDIEEILPEGWGDGQKHYQSKRNPACFTDDFKQYYNVNDDARKMYDLQTANLETKPMSDREFHIKEYDEIPTTGKCDNGLGEKNIFVKPLNKEKVALNDGEYNALWYAYTMEIVGGEYDGNKFETHIGVRCQREFCGKPKLIVVDNGDVWFKKDYNISKQQALEASQDVEFDGTEQEKKDYEYFEFLIDHTVCELKDMVKTEKDPEKKVIIEETINDAEARNMKCVASNELLTMEEARLTYGQHCVKLHCVKCGNTITCRCSSPKVELNGICGQCEEEMNIEAEDKEEKTPKKEKNNKIKKTDKALEEIKDPKIINKKSEKNKKEWWKEKAIIDPLTGLPNRLASDLILTEAKEDIKAMLIADLDHFKNVNDTYGHQTGDEVLIKVADYLKNKFIATRWGGEEIVGWVIGDFNNEQDIEEYLNEIRIGIENLKFKEVDLKVTVTIGYIMFDKKENVDDQFSKIDKALYCGKESGRNIVIKYEEEMQDGVCGGHKEDENGKLIKNQECGE